MLKKSKELSRLKYEWKKDWKNQIVDIFIFGSSVKGKLSPNDVDICLVFRDKMDINVVKKIEGILGVRYHISSLLIDNFFNNPHSLAKTILNEGISLISGRGFAEIFSLRPQALYSYSLSNEHSGKKVRFVYLLRGRDGNEGLVKKWKGYFISNNAFIIPICNDADARELFDSWKIKYKRIKIMLMD